MNGIDQNGLADIASNVMNTLMGFRHNQVSENLMQTLAIELGKEYGKGNRDPGHLASVAAHWVLETSNHETQTARESYNAEEDTHRPEHHLSDIHEQSAMYAVAWGDTLIPLAPNQEQSIEMVPG